MSALGGPPSRKIGIEVERVNDFGAKSANQLSQSKELYDARNSNIKTMCDDSKFPNCRIVKLVISRIPDYQLRRMSVSNEHLQEITQLPLQTSTTQLPDQIDDPAIRIEWHSYISGVHRCRRKLTPRIRTRKLMLLHRECDGVGRPILPMALPNRLLDSGTFADAASTRPHTNHWDFQLRVPFDSPMKITVSRRARGIGPKLPRRAFHAALTHNTTPIAKGIVPISPTSSNKPSHRS